MRQFIAMMLSYSPIWLKSLYRVRGVFVRLLGLNKQDAPEVLPEIRAEDISLTPGREASFFIVRIAQDENFWIAETPDDKHLTAYFGIAVEPLPDGLKRFHVITIVKYRHWTGPVYFNLIRPFHHLVVKQMMKAGIANKKNS